MSKPALGRGLSVLMGGQPAIAPAPQRTLQAGNDVADTGERVHLLPLMNIRPSPLQPRKEFAAEALQELADSIREHGIIQPLIVRGRAGNYELIAGERRWRAAQLLNLPEIPALIREASDGEVLEQALIENLQREDLNPLEEALGYSRLGNEFQLTQEQISAKVGKSRASVANSLRLLKLPPVLQAYLRDGRISVGHAKVILGLTDEKSQIIAAERVIKDALNVRQTEGYISKIQSRPSRISPENTKPRTLAPADSNTARIEEKLREKFGTKVRLKYLNGAGSLEISYFSDEELQRILDVMGVNAD